jgi:hypothetical protein
VALLSSKKKAKPSKKPVAPTARFRLVLAQYVSRHATRSDATRAMTQLKLKGDDIAFILEEKA